MALRITPAPERTWCGTSTTPREPDKQNRLYCRDRAILVAQTEHDMTLAVCPSHAAMLLGEARVLELVPGAFKREVVVQIT